MYTPKEALKITRYKQAKHNALCVILGTAAFGAFVTTIGFVNADNGIIGAAISTAVTLVCAFLSWCEDAARFHWQDVEKKVIEKYGDEK